MLLLEEQVAYNLTNLEPKFTWSIDFETCSNDRANEVHEACGDYNVSAPSNIKDPVKIKTAIEAKRKKIGTNDALNWGTGAIVSFALTRLSSVFESENENPDDYEVISMIGLDEKKVLTALVEALGPKSGVAVLVGKNMKNFDIPFLIGRLIFHKMKVPRILLNSYNLIDQDDLFKVNSMGQQNGKLGHMCIWAGLDDKLMDGGSVPTLVDEARMAVVDGNMARVKEILVSIKNYNIDDTIKVALFFKRIMVGAGVKDA